MSNLALLTAQSASVRHFEFVFPDGEITVYDIDHGNRFVENISLPDLQDARGAAYSAATDILYVSFGGEGGSTGTGSLLAYNLVSDSLVWQRSYTAGVDRFALTPDGKTIYLPVGEYSNSGTWEIIDAATGQVTGSVQAGSGAHDTLISPDGRLVYLLGVNVHYDTILNSATNKVVRTVGPLISGGRPVAINRAQTIMYSTAEYFLGFQVDDLTTGKVLYTVGVPGFAYDPKTFAGTDTPSHGIALSPDERRLYLVDSVNGYVHVYDVSHVPGQAPNLIASVKLDHTPPHEAWLSTSSSGRYLYVGRSGDVIDTTILKIVDYYQRSTTRATALRSTGETESLSPRPPLEPWRPEPLDHETNLRLSTPRRTTNLDAVTGGSSTAGATPIHSSDSRSSSGTRSLPAKCTTASCR